MIHLGLTETVVQDRRRTFDQLDTRVARSTAIAERRHDHLLPYTGRRRRHRRWVGWWWLVTCSGYGGLVNGVINVVVPADASQHAVSVNQQCSTADRHTATPAPPHQSYTWQKAGILYCEIRQQERTAALVAEVVLRFNQIN